MLELLGFWAVGGLFGALIHNHKGKSAATGLLGGLILGPVLVWLMLLITPQRKCPHCAESIRKEAKVCKHCRSALTTAALVLLLASGCYEARNQNDDPQRPVRSDASTPVTIAPQVESEAPLGSASCEDVAELLCGMRICESTHSFTTYSDPSLTMTYGAQPECLRYLSSNCRKRSEGDVRSCFDSPPSSCTETGTVLLTPECGWVAR